MTICLSVYFPTSLCVCTSENSKLENSHVSDISEYNGINSLHRLVQHTGYGGIPQQVGNQRNNSPEDVVFTKKLCFFAFCMIQNVSEF